MWVLACALWFGSPHRCDRVCAFLLMGLGLAQTLWLGGLPRAPKDTLVIRRVSAEKPVYWLSVERREILVLSESWQRERGQGMLRKLGCLTPPEVYSLRKGSDLDLHWRDFHWNEIRPLLLNAPYLEIRVSNSHYRTDYWWPDTAESQASNSLVRRPAEGSRARWAKDTG